MPVLSVLIAACNVEDTIAETLDSVLCQTLPDIEILCVDDGSTDATPQLLARFAAQDARVRVLRHEQNLGRLAARCTAVEAAAGQYALFLDGDDRLLPNACEVLYREMQRQQVDVLQFGVLVFADDGYRLTDEELDGYRKMFRPCSRPLAGGPQALLRACFLNNAFSFTLWNKLYPTALLQKAFGFCRGLRLNMAEDLLASFFILCHAQTYGHTVQPFYCYRVGGGVSTQCHLPLTPGQIAAFSQEYQVCTRLEECLPQLPLSPAQLQPVLHAVRRHVAHDVLWAFFRRAHPADRPLFFRQLSEHYPVREFLADVVGICERERWLTLPQAAQCLHGLFAAPAHRPQTIGCHYYRLREGGTERVAALLVRLWQQAGYRVVVFTEQPPAENDYPLPPGTPRVVLPATRGSRGRFLAWQRLLTEHGIDLLVSHASIDPHVTLDSMAAHSVGVCYVLYAHSLACGSFAWSSRARLEQRSAYALCDVIVTLTDTDNAWWSALGLRSMRTVNPPLCPAAEVAPAGLHSHTAVWVGRLSAEKQACDAFDIAALVRRSLPDFRLIVAGGPEKEEEWQPYLRYVEAHGLTDTVLFAGFTTQVDACYRQASALLSTSQQEGWGMALTEAQLYGLPIVAYELPNIDLLRSGEGCFVVPQGDRWGAAAALLRLLQNRELRQAAGAAARRRAEELEAFDLTACWHSIFEAAAQPGQPYASLSQRPPLETAVCLAMQFAAQGPESAAPAADAAELEQLRRREEELQQQNAQYALTVQQLTGSTIFRVGRLVTWPLRRLKRLAARLRRA